MIKIRTILAVIWLICPAVGKSQGYRISGKIQGLPDGEKIYLVHALDRLPDTVSFAKIQQGGEFKFEGHLPLEGEWHYIKFGNLKEYIRLFLENSNITINGHFSEWPRVSIKGSRSHDDMSFFRTQTAQLNEIRDRLIQKRQIVTDSAYFKLLSDSISNVGEQTKYVWQTYIESHPESLYTSFLILQSATTLDEKQRAFDKLNESVKQSYYGQELKKMLFYTLTQSKIAVGELAPDFKSTTPEGKIISLKEIAAQGKITLVDFWASWCVPCRAETPELKKAYQLLHDKGFNILSISLDHNRLQWEKAISKDQMNWINVCQLRGREEDAAKLYGVNGIPAHFIIDQNMKILAIDLPGSPIKSSGHLSTKERLDFLMKALQNKL